MVVEDQTFEGLISDLKSAFQSADTISKLVSDLWLLTNGQRILRMPLLITSRFWQGK